MEAFHSSSDGVKLYQDVQKVASRKDFSCPKKPARGSFLVSEDEAAGCSFLVEG